MIHKNTKKTRREYEAYNHGCNGRDSLKVINDSYQRIFMIADEESLNIFDYSGRLGLVTSC